MTALATFAQSDVLSLPNLVLQNYTQYTDNISADSSTTYLTFLFRQDPGYWGFDNVSMKNSLGNELIVNGGFETGDPTGWMLVRQQGLAMDGVVVPSAAGITADDSEEGNYYWLDGSVNGVDGLAQAITTVAGQTYTLSFWLAGSGGSSSGSQCAGFDALVGAPVAAYEGNAILYSEFAVGMGVVAPVPEPSTLVLSAVGGLGTLLLFRRRKNRILFPTQKVR